MYDGSKESKVGYWKIETGSDTILSSAGIRPKVYSLQYVSAKILKEINKRLVTMNKELKKMKMKTKCIRELSYMFDEMKRLKGVYPFTQHKEKTDFFSRRNKNVTNTTLFSRCEETPYSPELLPPEIR